MADRLTSTDYRVATGEVRAAARRIRRAAGQLGDVTPHDDLAGVASALPGTASAAAAETLASGWSGRLSRLAEQITSYGEGLAAAADRYDSSDRAVGEAFDGRAPSSPGRS